MPLITDILLLENPEMHVLEITFESSLPHLADKVNLGFDRINSFIAKENLHPSDKAYVCYRNWYDIYEKPITVSVGMPLAKPHPGTPGIRGRTIPGSKSITCIFLGGFPEMKSMYDEMRDFASARCLQLTGECYQIYYNGPEFEEHDYLTRTVLPVRS